MTYTNAQSYDVIIIGGGPAGSQCGLWLKMLGYNPVILEKNEKLGGLQLQNPYENHWIACVPGHIGKDIAGAIEFNIKRHGVAHILGVSNLDISDSETGFHVKCEGGLGEYQLTAPKLVIATGVVHETGGFKPSENIIIASGEVINNRNFSGLDVAILGGGDTAAENYFFIKEKGANSVKVFARTLRARKEFTSRIPQEDLIVGSYDVDEKEVAVNNDKFDIMCIMYGWKPINPLSSSVNIELNEKGFFKTDDNYRTSYKDIYAIGECVQKIHPCVITAMSDGVVAAKAIQNDIEYK